MKTKSNMNLFAALRANLRSTYIQLIGYDPVEDDSNITNEEMEETLNEWEIENAKVSI